MVRHAVVGGELSRAEWEASGSHIVDGLPAGYLLGSDGTSIVGVAPSAVVPVNIKYATIIFVFGAGQDAINAAQEADQWLEVPFDCTINSVRLAADAVGDFQVDIWKTNFAGYPPTDANSITSVTPPALVAQIKSENTALTGWTTSITRGDWLRLHVDSATTVKRVTVSIGVTRT